MIKVFSKFGEELRTPDFIELSWNRKYFSSGSFSLYMPAKEYDSEIKYIKNIGRPETGIVQKVVFDKKTEGDFVTLSGFFIEQLLNCGTFGRTQIVDGTAGNDSSSSISGIRLLLYSCFVQHTERLKNSIGDKNWSVLDFDKCATSMFYETLVDADGEYPSNLFIQIEAGEFLGDALYKTFEERGYGYYCAPEFNNKNEGKPLLTMMLKGYKGKDLSDKVFFGNMSDTVKNVEFAIDESGICTRIIAIQLLPDEINYNNQGWIWKDGKWQKAIYEEYVYETNAMSDLGKVYPTKAFFAQIDNIEQGNEKEVREKMKNSAKLELLNNYKIEHISADIIQNRFYYLKDYDLGDICTISVDEVKRSFKARIVEINEVHAKNCVEIQIILGTPQKIEYRKVVI